LEASLSPSDLVLAPGRSDIGEASLYGVYFDDTEYDYMQHLRPVGEKEEGFESILLEAPKKQSTKRSGEIPISLHDLPPEVLPSAFELPRDFDRQAAISSSISGLQPDMDPHLRQTLEALDDDAFVDDGLDDEFFGELIKDGERDASAPFDYEFKDDDAPTDGSNASGVCETGDGDEAGWEARFALFKKEQKGHNRVVASPPDSGSEDVDTVGQMPEFSAMRGRYSRGVASDASGFSISSSSIFRSDGLRDLDDRFDQVSVMSPVVHLCTDQTCRLRRSTSKMKGVKTNPRTQMTLNRHQSSLHRERTSILSWTISYITTRYQAAK
jgi:protein LTV1